MKYLIANWKLNHTINQGEEFLNEFFTLSTKKSTTNVLVAPPFTALSSLNQIIIKKSIPVSLCAQNICHFKSGAYTGEVSGEMIQEIGCQYVIIGHSERRNIFFESDDIIAQKYHIALDYSLNPVLCFGETLKTYQAKETFIFLKNQFKLFLGEKPPIIAYEPIWAIGSGLVPTVNEITLVVDFIKQSFPASCVLYGGSVNSETIKPINDIKSLSGFLVGGASLQAKSFYRLLSVMEENNVS